jgi:hypothetical protein
MLSLVLAAVWSHLFALGMAYALLAGLPPIYGLWAVVVPMLMYALLGKWPLAEEYCSFELALALLFCTCVPVLSALVFK